MICVCASLLAQFSFACFSLGFEITSGQLELWRRPSGPDLEHAPFAVQASRPADGGRRHVEQRAPGALARRPGGAGPVGREEALGFARRAHAAPPRGERPELAIHRGLAQRAAANRTWQHQCDDESGGLRELRRTGGRQTTANERERRESDGGPALGELARQPKLLLSEW